MPAELRWQEDTDSCYAFVAVSCIFADLSINQGEGHRGSEQLLMDCLHEDYPPKGGLVERRPGSGYPNQVQNAFQYTKDLGLLLNRDYPWEHSRKDCRRPTSSDEFDMIVIDKYRGLSTIDQVIETLKKLRAVSAAIFVTPKFKFCKDEIYTLTDDEKSKNKKNNDAGVSGYHGVTLIGYGKEKGTLYFVAQNSYPPNWGYRGFFKVDSKCLKDFYYVKGSKLKSAKKGKKNKSKKSEGSSQQTDPLSTSIPRYPGDVQEYTDAGNSWRTTSKEKKNLERQNKQTYDSLRQAAHVHKLVRKYIKEILVDGMSMTSLCEKVEEKIRTENGGVAFPTNCSLNNVVAYWTPDLKDNTVLKKDDVLKVEFGTHIDGLIVDSAFTVALNPMYENLLKASLEALNEGIKVAGIDVRLCDVGKAIKEVMDSFEVEINGKTNWAPNTRRE